MFDWPHSPPHRFQNNGTYFITAGTYLKRHHFRRTDDLDRLMQLLFTVANEFELQLQAWCMFSNHYHLVAQGAGGFACVRADGGEPRTGANSCV